MSLITGIIPKMLNESIKLQEQNSSYATEWEGRTPTDGAIDLKGSVVTAERLVRATTKPYPGGFIMVNGKKHIVWKARLASKHSENLCLEFKDGLLECVEWELA